MHSVQNHGVVEKNLANHKQFPQLIKSATAQLSQHLGDEL